MGVVQEGEKACKVESIPLGLSNVSLGKCYQYFSMFEVVKHEKTLTSIKGGVEPLNWVQIG